MSNKEGLKTKILGFVFLIVICVILFYLDNIIAYMLCSSVFFIMIFVKAKYSFFSAISFILVFSLFQTMIQALTGRAYGMIQNSKAGIPLYEGIHGICTVSFLAIELLFVYLTSMIENEKALYRTEIRLSNFTAIILILASVAIIILMFPSFPDFQLHLEKRRTQGVMKNYGWVLTALVLAGITVDKSRTMKKLWIGYLFLFFWIFGHSERVEGLGFVIYLALKLLNRNTIDDSTERNNIGESKIYTAKSRAQLSLGKRISLLTIIFVLLVFLVWLGLYRDSFRTGLSDYSLTNIMKKLFVQSTAGDVVYVFDCAVHMWKRGDLLYGKTYLSWILNLIPGAGNELNASAYIRNYYFTMGGALFFTEPMMNFGIIGVFVTNIIFFLWYSFVVKKKTMLRAMIFMPMIIEIFRTAWYGRNGWELASFVEIPLLYLGITLITNRIVVKNKK